jgi:hypothetical protein
VKVEARIRKIQEHLDKAFREALKLEEDIEKTEDPRERSLAFFYLSLMRRSFAVPRGAWLLLLQKEVEGAEQVAEGVWAVEIPIEESGQEEQLKRWLEEHGVKKEDVLLMRKVLSLS